MQFLFTELLLDMEYLKERARAEDVSDLLSFEF